MTAVQPYVWQEPCIAAGIHSLNTFGVFANASEMGTGKTLITCFMAQRRGRALVVVCPKSVVPDWEEWGERLGLDVQAVSYGKLRTGKTPHGHWQIKGEYFKWTVADNVDVVFDEAHSCAGLQTQQAELLCAAKRQKLPLVLLSGTLAESPLKMRALGYALGLHKLHDFWTWAESKGVTYVPRRSVIRGREVIVRTPEWDYAAAYKRAVGERIMEGIREDLGARFVRIRKADVPGFPEKQIIPLLLPTKRLDTSAFESGNFGYEARMAAELLKAPAVVDRTRDLIDAGHSVAVFVNYLDTLNTLREAFPDAAIVCGGQSSTQRVTNLNKFQDNETFVILVITQAGGTGVSLHDLHGRPRSSILCPGTSAAQFLQAIDRIHRAGAKSHATIYVAFAGSVPVERRARDSMEAKINNLSALNDADLLGVTNPHKQTHAQPDTHPDPTGADDAPGSLPESPSPALPEGSGLPDKPLDSGGGHPHEPDAGGPSPDPLHDAGRGRVAGDDCDSGGHHGAGATAPGSAGHDLTGGPGLDCEHPGPHNPASPGREEVGHSVPAPLPGAHPRLVGGDDHPGPGGNQMVRIIKPTALAKTASGNHVVRKHARSSPSKLKNKELCPSYEGDNDGPVHPVTLRGTAMHEALETGNDEHLLTERDNEELRLVTMCREFQDAEAVPGEIVITEPHLKTHDPDVQGFADRVVLEPVRESYSVDEADFGTVKATRHARIRDYKMGWNAVDAPDINPQAIAYTVAVFLAYPDVTSVNFAFLIPRLDMVLEHTFQRSELPGLMLRISTIAERVRKLDGVEFNVVDTNCLYCGRKATCAALHAKVLPLARGYDDVIESKLPLPASFNPAELTDPQQVAYGLNLASVMESWIEQMRKRGTEFRRDNGVEIPGYDWVERSAPRVISNPVGAFEIATTEFGVSRDAFLSATKISVTQLSAVVADAAPRGEKAKAEERLTDRLMDSMCLTRGTSFHVLQRSRKKAPAKTLPAAAA